MNKKINSIITAAIISLSSACAMEASDDDNTSEQQQASIGMVSLPLVAGSSGTFYAMTAEFGIRKHGSLDYEHKETTSLTLNQLVVELQPGDYELEVRNMGCWRSAEVGVEPKASNDWIEVTNVCDLLTPVPYAFTIVSGQTAGISLQLQVDRRTVVLQSGTVAIDFHVDELDD